MTLRAGITHITDSGPECPACGEDGLWGYAPVRPSVMSVRPAYRAQCGSCHTLGAPFPVIASDPCDIAAIRAAHASAVPSVPSDFTRCGLNADWNCDAWHVGPGSDPAEHTGDVYLLDNEEGGWIVVRRWHLDDTGIYVGMPTGVYDDWCDGANDAIPELFETDDLDAAVAFSRSVLATLSEVK